LPNSLKETLLLRTEMVYNQVGDLTRSFPFILIEAIKSFRAARGTEAAAGIAYYTLFSFFPLLIIAVAVGSMFLDTQQVQEQVLSFVRQSLPPAEELVEENLQQLVHLRRAVGILASVGLLWSATSVFTAIAHNIDRAWDGEGSRNFLQWRLLGLYLAGAFLFGMLIISLISIAMFGLLSRLEMPLKGYLPFGESLLWTPLSDLVPWMLMLLITTVLYRWAPSAKVGWWAAGWGAVMAATLWEFSKMGFTLYLGSGMARYQLVYGTLGTVVALLLWVYLTALIVLFGAHLSAAIGHFKKRDSN